MYALRYESYAARSSLHRRSDIQGIQVTRYAFQVRLVPGTVNPGSCDAVQALLTPCIYRNLHLRAPFPFPLHYLIGVYGLIYWEQTVVRLASLNHR